MAANKSDTAVNFAPGALTANADNASATVSAAKEQGPALVDAWVAAKNAAAVAAVAEDEKAPAKARKAARRGLNVLKSRGVAVPERTHVARLVGDPIEGHEAWFVPPDGMGTVMTIVAARRTSGKLYVVHTTMREDVGVLDLRALEMSRTQLRASFDESARRMGYAPVPVPVDWARARIATARGDNAKSGAILPLGLDSHAEVLGGAPSKEPPHPVDAAKLEIPSGAAAASADLHREPELGAWLPSGPAVQELLASVGQKLAAAGGTEPDPAKIDDAVREGIDSATDRFFSPEVRQRVASRMKDASISILARTSPARAAEVMGTASAVLSAGLITSPPHEIPFLRGFFQKALAILASQSGGQLSIPVPLPEGEGAAAGGVARPGEKVSPGGIVLP